MLDMTREELMLFTVPQLRQLLKEQSPDGKSPKGSHSLRKKGLVDFLAELSVTKVAMSEAVAYRSKMTAEKKIEPMMTTIVKPGQFAAGIRCGKFVRVANPELKEDMEAANCLVVINGLTAQSPYYNKFSTNSGQTVRNAFPIQRVEGVLKMETTNGGISYSVTDKLMRVNDVSVAVELQGEHCHEDLYMMDEPDYFKSRTRIFETKDLRHFDVFIDTAAKTRGGNPMYVDSRIGVDAFAKRMGFRLEAHYKHDANQTVIDINKAGKRVHLPASASKDLPVFEGFVYEKTEPRVLTSEIIEPDGTKRPDLVAQITTFRKELPGGRFERRIVGHFPAFEVELFVDIYTPNFKRSGGISVNGLKTQRIVRDAMDGAFLFDATLAEKLKIGKQSLQARALYVDKGFGIVYPELREALGVDVAFFAGCTKGDPMPHMLNNELHFSVLGRAREAKERESVKLSRQVLNVILNAPMAAGLVAETKAEIERLMTFDVDALKQYVNYNGYEAPEESTDVDGEMVANPEAEEIQGEIDNLTLYLVEASKELALGSAAVNNKLLSLVKSTLKAIQRGQSLIVKDSCLRHMTVDPYSVVSFLQQGKYGVCADKHPNTGIIKDHAMMVELRNGQLVACAPEALLFRFPFLHTWEAQRVNKNQQEAWAGPATMSFYQRWAKKGYFQGLIIYSLWDMHVEGQSGADTDGDQTVVCKNKHVLDNFEEADSLFLDYSLVEGQNDGNLISGCPFEEKFELELKDYVPEEYIEFIDKWDIHFTDKKGNRNQGTIVRFPTSLEGNATLDSVLMHAMSRLNLKQLRKNDIGRFTNLQATIASFAQEREAAALQLNRLAAYMIKEEGYAIDSPEIIALQEDHDKLKKEVSGHKRLVFFLAIAIRWEIDAAKHGGAYREQMPFLAAFKKWKVSERAVRKDLQLLEEKYGIALQTLIIGNAE